MDSQQQVEVREVALHLICHPLLVVVVVGVHNIVAIFLASTQVLLQSFLGFQVSQVEQVELLTMTVQQVVVVLQQWEQITQ
jgi:hypothetical protein